MRILTILAACVAILGAQTAPFEGAWSGTLDAGGQKLRIGFNIKSQDGKLSATLDSPDQGALGLPLDSVTVDGNRIRFSMQSLALSYEGVLGGGRIEGTLTQGGQKMPLAFERGKPKAVARPQYPAPPFPYDAEEVIVSSGDVQLAGTFTHPKHGGPFAAILLVTGSGPQDRDETVFGQKPFLVISDYLTRAGYAVLRLDDRGTAKSTGSFRASGLAEFTGDALAAVGWLKARPDVNGKRIGILGHSEGGMVGPLAAVRSDDVAFVIMLAGPAQPFDELLAEQSAGMMRAGGAPEALIEADLEISHQAFAILRQEPDNAKARERLQQVAAEWKTKQPELATQFEAGLAQLLTPELRSLFAYSAAETLAKLRCPVLALFGGKDLQVPADSNIRAAAAAFTAGHVASFTLVKLAGLNHLFQTAKTGSVAEYAASEETISPRALDTMAAWLRSNVQ
ncbi:MAG: alpha/beta fold hydrolase [Bryobacteraceae bacterium]|jgi:pimeloyl-ACP methyl ester carboxylesterase